MEKGGEQTFYNQNGVQITSKRAVVTGKTYAMRNITSVTAAVIPANRFAAIVLALLGLCTALCGFGGLDDGDMGAGILVTGVVLLGLGILIAVMKRTKYVVQLSSSSGEIKAYISTDRQVVEDMVAAFNEAIIHGVD